MLLRENMELRRQARQWKLLYGGAALVGFGAIALTWFLGVFQEPYQMSKGTVYMVSTEGKINLGRFDGEPVRRGQETIWLDASGNRCRTSAPVIFEAKP